MPEAIDNTITLEPPKLMATIPACKTCNKADVCKYRDDYNIVDQYMQAELKKIVESNGTNHVLFSGPFNLLLSVKCSKKI